MAIRLEVRPKSGREVELFFHQRKRVGGMATRHPTIDAALESFNLSCDLAIAETEEVKEFAAAE